MFAGKETVEARETSKLHPDNIYVVKRVDYGDRYIVNGNEITFYSKKVKKIDGVLMPTTLLRECNLITIAS